LTPNELDLSFPAPNDCAKFHQILFKIATVRVMTDTQKDTQTRRQTDASDLIIRPMLCNSNGTDNHKNTLSHASHQSVFSRNERSAPVLLSAQNMVERTEKLRRKSLAVLCTNSVVIGTAARPIRNTSLDWPADHRPNQ